MVRTVIGRVNRPRNTQNNIIMAGQPTSGMTFLRSSSGTVIDQYGNIQTRGNNVPRIAYNTVVGNNLLFNPRFDGAYTGNLGNPLPYISSSVSTGVTREFTFGTFADGTRYIDVHVFGTNNVNTLAVQFYVDTGGNILAQLGDTLTLSFMVQIIAGSMGRPDTFSPGFTETTATFTNASYRYNSSFPTTTPSRIEKTYTVISATCETVQPGVWINNLVGVPFDCVIRIWNPQFERGSVATEFSAPPPGTFGPSVKFIGNRLLNEEPRVNSVRNPRAEGAVVGAPGTLPTFWSNGGIATEVIGFGSESNIPYVDVRFTASAATTAAFIYDSASLPVVPGDYVTVSNYIKLIAGAIDTVLIQTNVLVRDSVNNSVLNATLAIVPTNAPLVTQRSSVSGQAPALSVNTLHRIRITFPATPVDFTLRLGGPQLEKGAFATSLILPPVGVPGTASRAGEFSVVTLGPWFNYSPPVTNHAPISEDATTWAKGTATVTPNAVTAPDGNNTADKLVEDAAAGFHVLANNTVTVFPAGTWVSCSVFVKAGERTSAFIQSDPVNRNFRVDLTNGVVSAASVDIIPIVIPYPNGWYRCGFAFPMPINGASQIKIYPYNGATPNYLGDGTSGLYVWGAEITAVPAPYSNLLPYPQKFEQWTTNGTPNDSSVVSNAAIAPDGTLTADKIVPSTAIGGKARYFLFAGSVSTTYTASVFVKAGGYQYASITLENSAFGTNARGTNVDLSIGKITSISTDEGANATITDAGNGWYRISVTATSLGSGGSYVIAVKVSNPVTGSSAAGFAGDGTSGVYAWGAKVDVGSVAAPYTPVSALMPTYIPNATGGAVTRSPPGPFTVVFRGLIYQIAPVLQGLFALDDTSFNNRVYVYVETNGSVIVRTIVGGIAGINTSFGSITPGSLFKIAVAVDQSSVSVSINGGAVVSATGVIPLDRFNRMLVSDVYSGALPMTGEVDTYTVYPYAAGASMLQQMST